MDKFNKRRTRESVRQSDNESFGKALGAIASAQEKMANCKDGEPLFGSTSRMFLKERIKEKNKILVPEHKLSSNDKSFLPSIAIPPSTLTSFKPPLFFSKFFNLKPEEKIKVQNSMVKFQGIKIRLAELFDNDDELYKNLPSEEISKLLKGEEVSFFEIPTLGDKKCIPRKFRKRQKLESDSSDEDSELEDSEDEGNKSDQDDQNGESDDDSQGQQNNDQTGNEDNGNDPNEDNDNSNNDDQNNEDDNNDEKSQNPQDDKQSKDDESDLKSIEDLIHEAKSKRIILLADEPESGHTTTLRMVQQKLAPLTSKKKIILYVELKNNLKFSNSDAMYSKTLQNTVFEILHKCECFSTPFEALLLQKLYINAKIIFLWDHLDVVKTEECFKLVNFMVNMRDCSSNEQWISVASKPDLVELLESKFSTAAYKYVEFSKKDIMTMALDETTSNYAVKCVINNQSGFLLNRFMRNPRILNLFIKAVSTNKDIDPNNAYKVFECIASQYLHNTSEYQALAVKIMGVDEGYKEKYFDDVCNDLKTGFSNENCLKDQSIINFLFADIFIKNLLTHEITLQYKKVHNVLRLFFHVCGAIDGKFKFFKTFIENYLQQNQANSKQIILTTIKKDFWSEFDSLASKPGAIDFISNFFKHDYLILITLWQIDKSVSFLGKIKKKKYFKEIKTIASKYLKKEDLKKSLKCHPEALKFTKVKKGTKSVTIICETIPSCRSVQDYSPYLGITDCEV